MLSPAVLLTFDVEEFDLPLEYGKQVELEEQFETGRKGLEVIEPLLDAHGIGATMFTTGRYALQFPESIKRLSEKHEIASHTFHHSIFEIPDLLRSKQTLETITGKAVCGLRMPRMKQIDMADVRAAGYTYDSSMNPTYIPGRYNHRDKPRLFYEEAGMLRLPASVTPNLRIPLFWLAFKNFPYTLYKKLAVQTLKKDGYLSLYFHPWEFTDLNRFSLPQHITRDSGRRLTDKLDLLITDLKAMAEFSTVGNYIREYKKAGKLSS